MASLDGLFIFLNLAIRAKDCIQVPADCRQIIRCFEGALASSNSSLRGCIRSGESYRIDGAPTLRPAQHNATNANFFSVVSRHFVFHRGATGLTADIDRALIIDEI